MSSNEDLRWSQYDFTEIPWDRIQSFGQRSLLYRDMFSVSYLLQRWCNYDCSYCWTHGRSSTQDHRPTSVVTKTIDEIKRQARDNGFNSFHFSFSGGEPTMHPGYLDILTHYAGDTNNTNYQSLHMTTNVSQGYKFWEKYVDATKGVHRVSVTASWHREHGIKKGKLEKHKTDFADKLVYMQENDIQVTINMVMVPEWFDILYEEANYFHERGINVTLKPQSDPKATRVVDGYTKENLALLHNGFPQRAYTAQRSESKRPPSKMASLPLDIETGSAVPAVMQLELTDDEGKKWYLDQAERLNAFNFNQFKGWKCSSGYSGIIIREPDGAIKRSYSCWDRPIGFVETGFKLFDGPTECISPSCVSSADSKIPKWKM